MVVLYCAALLHHPLDRSLILQGHYWQQQSILFVYFVSIDSIRRNAHEEGQIRRSVVGEVCCCGFCCCRIFVVSVAAAFLLLL